ncbi:MAG: hypothetical protein HPY54_15495 [Chthonomonadetes bacterium]|nr:hypothetical protein [Chthonomonadetes bacterium]
MTRRVLTLLACALIALAISAWLSWRMMHPPISAEQAQRLQAEELRAIAKTTVPTSAVKPIYHPPDGFVKPDITTGGNQR